MDLLPAVDLDGRDLPPLPQTVDHLAGERGPYAVRSASWLRMAAISPSIFCRPFSSAMRHRSTVRGSSFRAATVPCASRRESPASSPSASVTILHWLGQDDIRRLIASAPSYTDDEDQRQARPAPEVFRHAPNRRDDLRVARAHSTGKLGVEHSVSDEGQARATSRPRPPERNRYCHA